MCEAWGRYVGPSTGTNFWGALELIAQMRAEGTHGSVVTLICDDANRYPNTYDDEDWVAAQGLDPDPPRETIRRFLAGGDWTTR